MHKLVLSVAAALAFCSPALAHHSFAMFDPEHPMQIEGTIDEFQWTNPHVWVHVMVPDENGNPVKWEIEAASINTLMRMGWKGTTLKKGEHIAIDIFPLHDGTPGGSLIRVHKDDGSTVDGNFNAGGLLDTKAKPSSQ